MVPRRGRKLPLKRNAHGQAAVRGRIEHAIRQAEFIGWPALAASFRKDLEAFDAKAC